MGQGAYQKWSQIPNSRRVNGQQTAQAIVRSGAIKPIGLEVTPGNMTDHYDPSKQVVRMSQGVAMQPSVASMAIAAHELGHVQQDQQNSALMSVRSLLIPSAQLGPSVGITLIILGLIMNFTAWRRLDPVRQRDPVHARHAAGGVGCQPPRDEHAPRLGLDR